MVDYKKSTGSSATMMIRDTGSVVEFWITSGNNTTFTDALPWGYTVNGVTNNTRTADYNAGMGWLKLGSWTVTTDQTVYFRIRDTGTSGFGGPTSFGVFIERASAPNAPSTPSISGVTHNSMNVSFTDGANNGAAITARQLARNTTNTTSGATIVSSDGSTTVTGLAQGTTYYFWARCYNAKGWGPWSPVRSATTLKVPDAPDTPIISDISQISFIGSFTDNGNGGSPILERRFVYKAVNYTGDYSYATYTGVMTVTGLEPATSYYVWAQVRNSAGWSAFSPVAVIRTIAGAYVKVGDIYKEAIPYVRVDGVWKLARPWSRVAGVWKETT